MLRLSKNICVRLTQQDVAGIFRYFGLMKWSGFRKKQAYWVCQLLGWSGMVFIETVNYTFFIVQRFVWSVFYLFLGCALAGLVLTHVYRFVVRQQKIFTSSLYRVWIHAFIATLLMGFGMMVVTEIPFFVTGQHTWQNLRFIDIAGTVMNWMRYVGVWVIIYFMYQLLRVNAAILSEKLAIENLAKTTELELLKSQLNPHFLFNALNAIKALVSFNPEIARDAIVKLSELLRYTLNYGRRKFVSLYEELDEVRKYLELEQLRFEDRLEVQWLVPTSLHQQQVPPALVLTLVENAVKHGVAIHAGIGQIIIQVTSSESHLEIMIRNSGNYMPQASTGIGLPQIKQRLTMLYEEEAAFSISNQDGMVVAKLSLPRI